MVKTHDPIVQVGRKIAIYSLSSMEKDRNTQEMCLYSEKKEKKRESK